MALPVLVVRGGGGAGGMGAAEAWVLGEAGQGGLSPQGLAA